MSNDIVIDKQEQAMPVKIMGKRDVFISYKRENAEFVTRLYEELERHNISVWVDLSKLHKEVGEEYTERIHHGINSSKLFLFIYTKEIENSDFVINQELGYAISLKKSILCYPQDPIDLNTSRVRPYVEKIQWLDTADFDDQNIFLIRVALQRILNKITVFGNYTKLCGTGNNEFYNNKTFRLRVINKALFYDAPAEYIEELDKLGFYKKDKVQEVERHIGEMKPDKEELKNQLYDFIAKYYNLEEVHERLQQYIAGDKYNEIILPAIEKFDTKALVDIIRKMVACSFIDDLKKGKTMFNGAELGVYNIKDNRTTNSEHPLSEIDLYYSDYFTFKCMTEMYHVLCSVDDTHLKIEKVGDVHPLAPFLCSLGLGGFLAAYTEKGISLMWTKRSGNISDMWHFSYDETVSLLLDAAKKDGKILVDKDKTVNIDINQLLSRALKEGTGVKFNNLKQNQCGISEVGIIYSERLEIELLSQATIRINSYESSLQKIITLIDENTDNYLFDISKVQFIPLYDDDILLGKLISPESYYLYCKIKEIYKKGGVEYTEDVFISYSRKDIDVANNICKALKNAGISYFIDRQGIAGGMEFPAVLAKKIRECKIFLYLASNNSYISKFTMNEITYAFNKKEKNQILPYIIDGSSLPEDLEFVFAGINWRNIEEHPIESILITDIKNLLKKNTYYLNH